MVVAVKVAHATELDRALRGGHGHRLEATADPVRSFEEHNGPVGAPSKAFTGHVRTRRTGSDDREIQHSGIVPFPDQPLAQDSP
jgi:hypothetical protein